MLHHKLLDELLSFQNWLHHDTPVIKRTALAPLTSCSDPSGVFAVASLSPAQLPNINHRPYHPQMGRFAIGLTVPHYPRGSWCSNSIQIGFFVVSCSFLNKPKCGRGVEGRGLENITPFWMVLAIFCIAMLKLQYILSYVHFCPVGVEKNRLL
jgi:hypothetical protein